MARPHANPHSVQPHPSAALDLRAASSPPLNVGTGAHSFVQLGVRSLPRSGIEKTMCAPCGNAMLLNMATYGSDPGAFPDDIQ